MYTKFDKKYLVTTKIRFLGTEGCKSHQNVEIKMANQIICFYLIHIHVNVKKSGYRLQEPVPTKPYLLQHEV